MGCRGCEGEKNSLRSLRSKWGGYVLDECYPVEHTICISNKQETINSTIPLALVQKAMQSAQTSKENQHQPVPWRGTHSSVVLRMVWVTVVFINALVFALRHPRKTSTSALHGVERTLQSYCEWFGSPLSSSSCKSTKPSQ